MSTRLRKNLPRQGLLDGDGKEDYFKYGAPLYEASMRGDWKSAKAILDEKPELVRYSLTGNSETALHVAASANRSKQEKEFVKNLVDFMEIDDLTLQNKKHNTALYLAAASGNLETVQIMLKKNETLHTIPGENERLPLYAAALFGNKDVVKLLYNISDLSDDGGWNDFSRYYLIERCVQSDMFDIALDIVEKHRTIGRNNKPLASRLLGVLAGKPEAFSKSKSSFLKGTVNSGSINAPRYRVEVRRALSYPEVLCFSFDGLLKVANWFGNVGSWWVFEVTEFADDGVFGLEEDEEFSI